MPDLPSTINLWGLHIGADIVEMATETGLPLNYACALVEQESGGRNVWGSDGVQTGGAYVKGAEVTRESYLAYRALRTQGAIGNQGAGPVQLTATVYQQRADAAGGTWVVRANLKVGFAALAELMLQYGDDGIRRYNGSGPAAEKYRDSVKAKAAQWALRLGISPAAATFITPSPEVDLQDDERVWLQTLYDQVTGNNFVGWPTFDGGTGEKLSLVDYARRDNVEVRQLHVKLDALTARVAKIDGGEMPPTAPPDPAELSVADLLAELGRRMAPPEEKPA